MFFAVLSGLLLAGLVGGGCAAHDRDHAADAWRPGAWDRPAADEQGRPRSLATDSAALTELRGDTSRFAEPQRRRGGASGGASEWYVDRLDRQPMVRAGYRSPTVEVSWTSTRDHQDTRHGRVHDHYHQTTHRSSVTRTVR